MEQWRLVDNGKCGFGKISIFCWFCLAAAMVGVLYLEKKFLGFAWLLMVGVLCLEKKFVGFL